MSFTLRGLIKQCILNMQALLVNIIQIVMIGKMRKIVFNYYVLGFSKNFFWCITFKINTNYIVGMWSVHCDFCFIFVGIYKLLLVIRFEKELYLINHISYYCVDHFANTKLGTWFGNLHVKYYLDLSKVYGFEPCIWCALYFFKYKDTSLTKLICLTFFSKMSLVVAHLSSLMKRKKKRQWLKLLWI